jgi:hypothetical protein
LTFEHWKIENKKPIETRNDPIDVPLAIIEWLRVRILAKTRTAQQMALAEREKFEREHRGETLHDFELALHKLLYEATVAGLPTDEIQEVAEAIVNNTFLDDESAA